MGLSFDLTGPEVGPLVTFLHGGGLTRWMWHDVVAQLPQVRALLVDLPGHGGSRDVAWSSIDAVGAQVLDVVSDVAEAGADDVHVVGLSLGSYVGAGMLAQDPARFSTAMFSGMHPGGMTNVLMMKTVVALMAPITPRPFMARKTAQMLGLGPEKMDAFVREAGTCRPTAIRKSTFEVLDYAAPQELAACPTRTLFCAGSREHKLILNGLGTLADLMPRGSFQIADGLGHGWPGQDPVRFADMLSDHLACASKRKTAAEAAVLKTT